MRNCAYKWTWSQKYSDLLVMGKVFMVLRKEKRRKVSAETLALLEVMQAHGLPIPIPSTFGPDISKISHYISAL